MHLVLALAGIQSGLAAGYKQRGSLNVWDSTEDKHDTESSGASIVQCWSILYHPRWSQVWTLSRTHYPGRISADEAGSMNATVSLAKGWAYTVHVGQFDVCR